MLVVNPKECHKDQVSCLDHGERAEGNETVVSQDYILEPDEDLSNAISFEEFRSNAINHIRGLYQHQSSDCTIFVK